MTVKQKSTKIRRKYNGNRLSEVPGYEFIGRRLLRKMRNQNGYHAGLQHYGRIITIVADAVEQKTKLWELFHPQVSSNEFQRNSSQNSD
jgi:hypothetical protein